MAFVSASERGEDGARARVRDACLQTPHVGAEGRLAVKRMIVAVEPGRVDEAYEPLRLRRLEPRLVVAHVHDARGRLDDGRADAGRDRSGERRRLRERGRFARPEREIEGHDDLHAVAHERGGERA